MSTHRDEFCLREYSSDYVRWDETHGYQPVRIEINGVGLIDLVKRIEEPFVQAEIAERVADGEDRSEFTFEAGDYLYLPASCVYLPCRNLLDEPMDLGFVLGPEDRCTGKATALGCTCGITECWPLLVRIQLLADSVIWSDFTQLHRDWWEYDLGPFVFDQNQYEAELSGRP